MWKEPIKIASVSYKDLPQEVKAGDHILLSDGLVNLEVQSVVGDDIVTQVLNSGKMSDRKRVAVPGIPIKLPALSETDIKDIESVFHKIWIGLPLRLSKEAAMSYLFVRFLKSTAVL